MSTAVRSFFHEPTSTWSHVVRDESTGKAAVIDPVLDYDAAAGRTSHDSVAKLLGYLQENRLTLEWILETHAHADHLTAAPWIREQCGGTIAIGSGIREVQATFKPIFNLEENFAIDGSQFDRLFEDGETFSIGNLPVRVMKTPGHTNDSIAYVVGDAAFIGDTLFAPDYGTARCDFPGGDAGRLYDSIKQLYRLPPETRLFLCHDYPPEGREAVASYTVAEQRQGNVHLRDDTTRDEYIKLRTDRDRTLPVPALILPSIQVNIRAGQLPPAEENGTRYLKIPLDTL